MSAFRSASGDTGGSGLGVGAGGPAPGLSVNRSTSVPLSLTFAHAGIGKLTVSLDEINVGVGVAVPVPVIEHAGASEMLPAGNVRVNVRAVPESVPVIVPLTVNVPSLSANTSRAGPVREVPVCAAVQVNRGAFGFAGSGSGFSCVLCKEPDQMPVRSRLVGGAGSASVSSCDVCGAAADNCELPSICVGDVGDSAPPPHEMASVATRIRTSCLMIVRLVSS